ncbi:MAG: spore germination protein, partial [Firmicutes bacterium]|nr:spore germination protein [Bacillota bacterium]
MSLQPGRMGVAEGLTLVVTTTVSSIFMTTWSPLLDQATTATWMIPLVEMVLGVIVLYVFLYVFRYSSNDFFSACEKLLGLTLARLVACYYVVLFFLDAVLVLRQFTENTLITALPELPFEIATAWYCLIVVIVLYIGIEPIARAGYIIMPMSILAGLIELLLLIPQYQLLYLTPWNGPGLDKIILTGIHSSGINLGLLIPIILAVSFQNEQTVKASVLYGMAIGACVKSCTLAGYIAAFGVGTAREKVLPFYEIARLVYINRYIQRTESLIILVWVINDILQLAILTYIGLYLLGRVFNLPSVKPLIIPILLIIANLSMLP